MRSAGLQAAGFPGSGRGRRASARRRGQLVTAALVLAAGLSLPAAADPPAPTILGIDEVKLGALHHDVPRLWSGFSRESSPLDVNIEVLFRPWAVTFGGYLRPALGATINPGGDTSKAYADLRWETQTPSGVFFALGMGAVIHDGELGASDPDRKALGARVLFHPSAEIGWRFDGVHSVSLYGEHISNGFSRRYNEGMDTIGLRFGRRLGPAAPIEREAPSGIASFAGTYVGAFAGAERLRDDWYWAGAARSTTDGLAWGGFAGHTWQSGRGVFGVEVDAVPAHHGSTTPCVVPGIACSLDVHGLYSARARFGWVLDRTLLYGTGGVVVGAWEASAVNLATGQTLDAASGINFGVAVGAGLEWRLLPRVGVRAEIMHYGMAGWDLEAPAIGAVSNQLQSTVGRVGLSWHLN